MPPIVGNEEWAIQNLCPLHFCTEKGARCVGVCPSTKKTTCTHPVGTCQDLATCASDSKGRGAYTHASLPLRRRHSLSKVQQHRQCPLILVSRSASLLLCIGQSTPRELHQLIGNAPQGAAPTNLDCMLVPVQIHHSY